MAKDRGIEKPRAKKIKKYITKRRTLDSWLNFLGYSEDDFCIPYSWFLFQTIHNRYFFSRIRLVLFSTLYKFIVWAGWAKTQSCLGFNPKLVLTIMIWGNNFFFFLKFYLHLKLQCMNLIIRSFIFNTLLIHKFILVTSISIIIVIIFNQLFQV